ncbi:MAG: DUF2304 family protein [Candidatus Altiarchaeota archaeon]|nr:DUF2304 family protein [Candidatus Altiarchaeota archaeon]
MFGLQLSLIQAIAVVFALFALSRAFLGFRSGKLSWPMFVMWFFVWSSVIVFLAFPDVFQAVTKFFGMERPLDFMIVIGIIGAYYLVFRIYVYLEDIRSDLAKVVREVSIGREKK